MRSPTARMAAIVALLLAALTAWWLLRDDDTASPAAAETAAVPTDDGPAGRGRLDGAATKKPELGAMPWTKPGTSVSGTVRSTDGSVIADAQVCLWWDHPFAPANLTRDPKCVTSDAKGHYRIEDVPPVRVEVHAMKEGFVPRRYQTDKKRGEIHLHVGEERKDVDLTLSPGGVAVSGFVKDLSGGVIEGALVTVTSRSAESNWGTHPKSIAYSDADGKFTVWADEGRVWVRAASEGYTGTSRDGIAPGLTFELFLTPESTISGRVIRADTKAPVANASVSVQGSFFGWGSDGSALTDEDGRFVVDRLQPGTYHPGATAEGLYGKSAESVHVGLAESAEDIVIEVHPLASLQGTIVVAGTKGQPCDTGGSVSLTGKNGNTKTYWGRADDNGNVSIRAIMPGTYSLSVDCEELVRRADFEDLTLEAEPVHGQVWELSRGIALTGKVVDTDGKPIAYASVSANTARAARGSGPTRWTGAQTEADGTFVVHGLTEGKYKVDADATDYLDMPDPVEIEVGASSPEPLTLTLEKGGEIEGKVTDAEGQPVAGATVRVSNSGWGSSSTTADDGSYHLRGAKPGTHRVSASRGWRDEMRAPGKTDDDKRGVPVTVVAGEVVVADLVVEAQSGTISGRVVDADGGTVADAFVDHTRESDSAAAAAGSGRQSVRWGSWGKQAILTDEDGNFTIDDLADGKYTIRAYRKGGGEATVEHVEVGSSGIEVAISETGSISGVVKFEGGGTPDDFKVVAHDKEQSLWHNDSFYKTDGAFTLSELAPGTYEIVVTSDAGDAKTETTLEAGADVTDLKLELAPRITVTGRLLDLESNEPVPGMRVVVSSRKGSSFNFGGDKGDEPNITDESGRFTFENAPTGKVQIMALPLDWSDQTYGWTMVNGTIPHDAKSHDIGDMFAVPSRRKRTDDEGDLGFKTEQRPPGDESDDFPLKVAFVRPDGPAATAGLTVGAVITTIDGHDVTGTNSYRFSSLTNVLPGTSVKVGIEGGDEISIVATKKDD